MNRRTVLKQAALGAGVIGLSTSTFTGSVGAQDLDIVIASSYEPGHVNVDAAERFAEYMSEETDGEFSADIVAGGAYGGEEEITALASEGVVQVHADSRWPYTMYTPEYEFINIPLVFEDFDHLVRVSESEEFQPAHEGIISEGNQRLIGQWIDRDLRWFTSNEPVRHPDDVQGMDLRLPPLDTWVTIWEEIGANPTTVALDELYSALQTGVVEASEGDIPQIHAHALQEVQDYISFTGHHVQVGALYANEDWYQGLDETQQELVDETSTQAVEEVNEELEEEIEVMKDELAEEAEIIEDVDRDAFVEAALPAVEGLFEDFEGEFEDWHEM